MLLYYPFWMFMGFILHIYIIFGTNLLTGGPAHIAVFCLFQYFEEKEYQTESKRNETYRKVIFGKKARQDTWGARALLSPGRLASFWTCTPSSLVTFVPKITLPKVSFHLDSV